MIANNKKKIENTFIGIFFLQLLIICNYYSWIFEPFQIFIIPIICIIFLTFFLLIFNIYEENRMLSILIIVMIILTVGSPSFHWDARSIWLFNAKKLFYDENLSFITNNYGDSYINIYPMLGSTLASSIAKLFGFWNEVFPKLFNIILATPPLIYLSFFLKNKVSKTFYIFFILLIFEKTLIIGEMDGLLALYFVSSAVIAFQLFYSNDILFLNKELNKMINSNFFSIFALLNFTFLTLLKKEGIVYFFLIFISCYLSKIFFSKKIKFYKKNITIFIMSVLSISFWNYFLNFNNLNSDMHPGIALLYSDNFIEVILLKILQIKNYMLISGALFLNKTFVLSIIFFTFFASYFFIETKNIKKNFSNILLVFLILTTLYLGFVFFVYLITTWDLSWHLKTSAQRVILPLAFLISYFSLIIVQTKLPKLFAK